MENWTDSNIRILTARQYEIFKIKAGLHKPADHPRTLCPNTQSTHHQPAFGPISQNRCTFVHDRGESSWHTPPRFQRLRQRRRLEKKPSNRTKSLQSVETKKPTQKHKISQQQSFEIDEQCQQHQPRSVPICFTVPSSQGLNAGLLAQLNEQNCFEKELKRRYDDAISAGYLCFWAIPKCENGDSKYIAFLLAKSKKNKEFLQEAEDRAKEIFASYGVDASAIKFVEIREWREVGSKNPYKCKGFLLNCKNNEIAVEIRQCLMQSIFPKVIGFNQNTKICRLVDKWFGDDFMSFVLFFFCIWFE